MTYTYEDAAADDFYERLSEELYPAHKEQAISEFTSERLRSYYLKNPGLTVSGRRAFRQAKELYRLQHLGPALVCGVTVIEVFFKAGFLKPVVYGLVHSDALAEAVVKAALSQPGYKRYEPLLSKLYSELVGKDLSSFARKGSSKPILVEASEAQAVRNRVVHEGYEPTDDEARQSIGSAAIVMVNIWRPMLNALGLRLGAQGTVARQKGRLTPHSRRAPTARHLAGAAVLCIIGRAGQAPVCWVRLSSNVRHRRRTPHMTRVILNIGRRPQPSRHDEYQLEAPAVLLGASNPGLHGLRWLPAALCATKAH